MAGELNKTPDHVAAFKNYDRLMRPYVEDVQNLPPGVPWVAYAKTKFGVLVRNKLAGFAASGPVQALIKKLPSFGNGEEKKFRLPEYAPALK